MRTFFAKLSVTKAEAVQQYAHSYRTAQYTTVLNISQLEQLCGVDAAAAGWYIDPQTGEQIERNFGETIALIHSELSEALEAARKDLQSDKIPEFSGLEEELADALIRIFDMSFHLELRLGEAFLAKLTYNRSREDHKLENRKKEDGKQF